MTNELQYYQTALSTGSLGAYIHWVNQIPLLSHEEEQSLAHRLREHNDIEAARQLVMAHLRFVVKLARGYVGYGLPLGDLIQEGNIGLMKAVKRFNVDNGARLVSFAVHWIRAEIHEFIIRNWRIVKIATTKAQRKLFFNLRKMSKKLGWLSRHEAQAMADELNVNIKDVYHMESRLMNSDESFDHVDSDDSEARYLAPAQYLENKNANPERLLTLTDWASHQEKKLYSALEQLDERSQEILQTRWLAQDKKTLQELAEKYSVSAERIRQLEHQAMQKLRIQLEE